MLICEPSDVVVRGVVTVVVKMVGRVYNFRHGEYKSTINDHKSAIAHLRNILCWAVFLLKTNFSNKSKSTKKSRIQRRDCKIQRGIVKYYTAKSVGRARQGFVQGDIK